MEHHTIRSKRTVALFLAAGLAATAAGTAAAQNPQHFKAPFESDRVQAIDPALLQLSKKQARLPVIVVLAEQPQHSISKRIRAKYRKELHKLSNRARKLTAELQPREHMSDRNDETAYTQSVMQDLPSAHRKNLDAINRQREATAREMRRAIAKATDKAIAPSQKKATSIIEAAGGKVTGRTGIVNALRATVPADALKQLAGEKLIAEIAYDRPGEPELDNQVQSLGATIWWEEGYDGGIWDAGVLDNGVDHSHPAIADHNFFKNTELAGRHATAIACMYGSRDDTHKGLAFGLDAIIAGAAGEIGDSIISADWMVRYADDEPDVINYSWGNGPAELSRWGTLARFIDALVYDYDIAWAKSAGNSGWGTTTITQPGENYNAFTVANVDDNNTATRSDDIIRWSSSRGPTMDGRRKPDIAAPGHNTYTCAPGNSWREMGGTSSAAPKVGAGTLLLRDAGHEDPMTMKAVLINSAESWEDNDTQTTDDDRAVPRSEWNKSYGWGYLDLQHAFFHRNDFFTGTVTPKDQGQDYRLFKGKAARGDKATLVWERQVDYGGDSEPVTYRDLSDLDIILYQEANGLLEDVDASVRDNVQQVSSSKETDVVIKVYSDAKNFDGAETETFALATEENFTEATGPELTVDLASVRLDRDQPTYRVVATINNTGDLDAHEIMTQLDLSDGLRITQGPRRTQIDHVANGDATAVEWTIEADANAQGDLGITLDARSHSYGETFEAAGTLSF